MKSHPTTDHVVRAVAVHGPATKEEISYAMGVSDQGGLMAIKAAVTGRPPLIRTDKVDLLSKSRTYVLSEAGERRYAELEAE